MEKIDPAPAPPASGGQPGMVLVWDAPVRVFHWLLVLSFAGAYLTAESDRWMLVHVTLGYTMGGLVAFRILWGVLGTRYARFTQFVRGPSAVTGYFRSLRDPAQPHYLGHNPAGALAILALLGLAVVVTVTGWLLYQAAEEDPWESLHEGAANIMLGVVVLHIAAVFLSSWIHHEKLVRAMFTGRKPGTPGEGIPSARWGVATALVAAVLAFWWRQGRG